MYKQHGLKSFYNGLSPGLLRHFIYSGVRVPFYEYSRNYYMSTIGKNRQVVSVQYPNSHQTYPPSIPGKPRKSKIPAGLTLPEASLLAGFSGSLGQFFASPTDLLKVRLQSGEAKTFIQAYKSVPNFTSFWKGSTPNIMRAFFVNQGDLMTYDKLKKSLLTNTTLQEGTVLHFICSFGAGLVACSLALPFDTVKTRIMNQPIDSTGQGKYYRNMRHAFYVMVKNEGLFSLYRGFFAAWPRMALWSQCFWHANENIRAIFDLPPF